jgi:hypothetical protein
MLRTDLKHGDVLCFKYLGNHQNLVERGIRLVEGSRFVHVGVVQEAFGALLVLEQNGTRTFVRTSGYTLPAGAEMWCFRPMPQMVPPTDTNLLRQEGYNYGLLIDCLINHGIERVLLRWDRREFFGKLSRNQICSTLVAYALNFWPTALPEPDDFANSPLLTPMGKVDL